MASIAGLNKAAVLAGLFNASKPLGMGFLQYNPKPMTIDEAEMIISQTMDFDYLQGRVMKISLDKDEVNTLGYNRDNGPDAAEKVIEIVRNSGNVNDATIQKAHAEGTVASGVDVQERLHTPTVVTKNSVHLGLADAAHVLGPAVQKAIGDRN